MNFIWIITIILFALFLILFVVRVIQKKRLLSDVEDTVAQQAFSFKEFLKMAFPAVFFYALLYVVFLALCACKVFGDIETEMNAAKWMPSLFALYFAIWLLLHIIDMDCRSRNQPFALVLRTINTNIGVNVWNFVLLGISLVVIVLSLIEIAVSQRYYICLPLFSAVLISVLINLFVGTDADWYVKSPSEETWRPNDYADPEKVKIKAGLQDDGQGQDKQPNNPKGKTPVERVFNWNLKDKWGIAPDAADRVKVTLFKEDWEDPQNDLRKKNPFFGKDANGDLKWKQAASDLANSAKVVVQGPDGNGENSEQVALETIVNNAMAIASKYNMAGYEVPELLLNFCQYAVDYKKDNESSPINQWNDDNGKLEYFRFAIESVYDKEGDCDCKAVLACRLLQVLGMDAKLVSVCEKGTTVPNHAAVILKDNSGRYKKCPGYPEYTYCEATGEGWCIGEMSEEIDPNSLRVLA